MPRSHGDEPQPQQPQPQPRKDSLAYIREHYNLSVYKGGSAMLYTLDGTSFQSGTITGASEHGHILIRLEGETRARPYHPRDERIRYGLDNLR